MIILPPGSMNYCKWPKISTKVLSNVCVWKLTGAQEYDPQTIFFALLRPFPVSSWPLFFPSPLLWSPSPKPSLHSSSLSYDSYDLHYLFSFSFLNKLTLLLPHFSCGLKSLVKVLVGISFSSSFSSFNKLPFYSSPYSFLRPSLINYLSIPSPP